MENTNYSFDFMNLQEEGTNATPQATSGTYTTGKPSNNKVSQGQMKFYIDLCKQKGEVSRPIEEFTFETMSQEIDRLIKLAKPSPAQLDLIREKVRSLNALKTPLELDRATYLKIIGDTPQELLNKFNTYIYNNAMATDIIMYKKDVMELSGGKDGTASKLISVLIELEKAHADNMKPEQAQVELLVTMFLYPDADFESFGISRKVDLGDGLWRKPTPQEFAQSIIDNMSKKQANIFLDTNRGGFYEWKKTRIRPEQLRYIMQLEKQLGDDSKLKAVEQAVSFEGDIIDMLPQDNESIKGTAYVMHTEEQLIHFTVEQASQFIDQLKAEISRKSEFSITEDYQDYNTLRKSKDINEAIDIEYQEFQNIMYSLEAIAGYQDEALHEVANYNIVADDSRESQIENRKKIRGFMIDMIETGAITYAGLLELGRESVTLQRILLDM